MELVLVNIAGFVLIGISIYMSKYLTQKGINKAIHEDSRKTTEIIESVRHSFQKDLEVVRKDLERGNELFKSQLQLINENQQSLNDEERNALVQFSSESEKQIHDLSNFDLPGLLTQSIEQNYAVLNGIPRGLGGLFTSYTKVEIFVNDLNILTASSELFQAVLEFAAKAGDHAKQLTIQINAHNKMLRDLEQILADKDSSVKSVEDFRKAKEKVSAVNVSKPELLKVTQAKQAELGTYYTKCFGLQRDFNELVGKYLRSRRLK